MEYSILFLKKKKKVTFDTFPIQKNRPNSLKIAEVLQLFSCSKHLFTLMLVSN